MRHRRSTVVRKQMVSFRADRELLAALTRLEAAVGPDVAHKGKRSVAIRRALLEADARLDPESRSVSYPGHTIPKHE